MDDSVFCFAANDPQELEAKAGQLSGMLLQKCAEFAMTPNLSQGKTAALLVFQGPGARKARTKLFGPQASRTLPIVTEGGTHFVHVVNSYVHLGCLLHAKGDMRQEARRRFSLAQTAFQQHRRLLYQNRHLSLPRRAELCRTLILSKYVYGCESWTLKDARTRHCIHSSLMKLYRRLLPGRDPHLSPLSDDAVLTSTGLPDPSVLFRIQRLRHLGALYACQDSTPWGLINADQEWTELISSDLEWMWAQLHHCSDLPDPRHHFAAWTYLMKYHRGYWKRLVTRAGRHHAAQRNNQFVVQSFHRGTLETLAHHGCLLRSPPATVKTLPDQIFACMACEKRFHSRAGCGAHMCKVHQIIHPVRYLFDTTQCGCCLREFHSYDKLKAHLLRSEFCRRSLERRGHFVRPAAGIGSTEDQSNERRHDGILPPLQAQGPCLPGGARALRPDYNLELFEAIYSNLLDADSLPVALATTRACIQNTLITWEDLCKTLRGLEEEATAEDLDVLPIGAEGFAHLLRVFYDPSSWPFLGEDIEIEDEHWHRDLAVLEQFCREEAALECRAARTAPVARGFGRDRFILHLFSGRRRRGDLQFYIDKLTSTCSAFNVFVISLDVVLSSVWGDLLNPTSRTFWLGAIRDRQVVAMIGGPPCETWSQARERAVAGDRRAPRVLRNGAAPWGLDSLRLRELLQVRVGNSLMGFQIEATVELYCTGGVAITEHPAPPVQDSSATIWRTPIMVLLQTMPGCELTILAQGLWGAKSPKPTAFFTVNAPGFRQALRAWQVAKDTPKVSSIVIYRS